MNGNGMNSTINPPSRHVPPTAPSRMYICPPNLCLISHVSRSNTSRTHKGKPAANADRRKLLDARALAATGLYALKSV